MLMYCVCLGAQNGNNLVLLFGNFSFDRFNSLLSSRGKRRRPQAIMQIIRDSTGKNFSEIYHALPNVKYLADVFLKLKYPELFRAAGRTSIFRININYANEMLSPSPPFSLRSEARPMNFRICQTVDPPNSQQTRQRVKT